MSRLFHTFLVRSLLPFGKVLKIFIIGAEN